MQHKMQQQYEAGKVPDLSKIFLLIKLKYTDPHFYFARFLPVLASKCKLSHSNLGDTQNACLIADNNRFKILL